MDKIIPAFGWMLIHSLWQGMFFAVIAGVALMLAKNAKAAYRYNIVLVLFSAFIITVALTFLLQLTKQQAVAALKPVLQTSHHNKLIPTLFSVDIRSIKQLVKIFIAYFSTNQPIIVLTWFIFFLFKSVKMFGCIVYNQQVKTRQISAPPREWFETVELFTQRLQIKKAVRLLQSAYIKMPVVIGHLKPVILIPAALMVGLPADQLEAILLHELAHIRRNDYFINFLQNVAETIFFFNPGLLWISALLREERENCCDDIALAQTQNKKGFVQALISFKEYQLHGSNYAIAFPGKKNYLMRRVSRIITSENATFGLGEKLFFSMSMVLIGLVIGTVAFGKIKDKVNLTTISAHYKSVPTPAPAISISQNATVLKINHSLKHKENSLIKMQPGITGILTLKARALLNQPESNFNGLPAIDQDLSQKQVEPTDAERAEQDQVQAKKDEQQALVDQKQALIDEAQATKDQEKAAKEQEQVKAVKQNIRTQQQVQVSERQAKADYEQSLRNQQQAVRDREQAARNQEQAKRNEEQLKSNEEQALRNRQQEQLNELQNKRNQDQEKRNKEQALRNQEQALRNELQAKKNQEQAVKNSRHVHVQ